MGSSRYLRRAATTVIGDLSIEPDRPRVSAATSASANSSSARAALERLILSALVEHPVAGGGQSLLNDLLETMNLIELVAAFRDWVSVPG